jgi:hypothetical protein
LIIFFKKNVWFFKFKFYSGFIQPIFNSIQKKKNPTKKKNYKINLIFFKKYIRDGLATLLGVAQALSHPY